MLTRRGDLGLMESSAIGRLSPTNGRGDSGDLWPVGKGRTNPMRTPANGSFKVATISWR